MTVGKPLLPWGHSKRTGRVTGGISIHVICHFYAPSPLFVRVWVCNGDDMFSGPSADAGALVEERRLSGVSSARAGLLLRCKTRV